MTKKSQEFCKPLKKLLKDEIEGIELYENLRDELEEKGYTAIARWLEEIKEDEKEHLEVVSELVDKFQCVRPEKKRKKKKRKHKKVIRHKPTYDKYIRSQFRKTYMVD